MNKRQNQEYNDILTSSDEMLHDATTKSASESESARQPEPALSSKSAIQLNDDLIDSISERLDETERSQGRMILRKSKSMLEFIGNEPEEKGTVGWYRWRLGCAICCHACCSVSD